MCVEGERFLATYRNLIGLGVFLMLIAFSGVYLYALDQERQMAENCGFTDGKLKCACTSDAWDAYIQYEENSMNLGGMKGIFPEYFNNSDREKSFELQKQKYNNSGNLEEIFND